MLSVPFPPFVVAYHRRCCATHTPIRRPGRSSGAFSLLPRVCITVTYTVPPLTFDRSYSHTQASLDFLCGAGPPCTNSTYVVVKELVTGDQKPKYSIREVDGPAPGSGSTATAPLSDLRRRQRSLQLGHMIPFPFPFRRPRAVKARHVSHPQQDELRLRLSSPSVRAPAAPAQRSLSLRGRQAGRCHSIVSSWIKRLGLSSDLSWPPISVRLRSMARPSRVPHTLAAATSP